MTAFPSENTPVFNYTSTNGVDWTPQYNGWTRSDRVVFANDEFWANDQSVLYRSSDGVQSTAACRRQRSGA